MNEKISIILSTYNEKESIEKTIRKIFEQIDNTEIVVVDDNSTDGTLEILNNIQNPNLKIYSRKSRGLASAFLLGMINSSGNYVGWIDSNMPQLVPFFNDMKKKLANNDLVLLSRYVKDGGDERSYLRVMSSKIINFVCRLILSNKIKDYTSSIFLMHRNKLGLAVPIAYGHGEFFIEFLYKLQKNGARISELAYIQPPDVEGSKTASNIFRFLKLGLDYMIRILITRFRNN